MLLKDLFSSGGGGERWVKGRRVEEAWGRFSKVRESLRTRNAVAKSQTLMTSELFYAHILIMSSFKSIVTLSTNRKCHVTLTMWTFMPDILSGSQRRSLTQRASLSVVYSEADHANDQ